jgi:hypothetical protein
MKKLSQFILLISMCLAALSIASAQIPNAGFESWTALGAPTGWTTLNIPPLAVPITQSNDAHSGSSSMQGTVVLYLGAAAYPPMAWFSFPISTASGALNGWYKFSPVGGDLIEAAVFFYKNGIAIAAGDLSWGTSASNYTQFSVPISASPAPDSAWIEIVITPSPSSSDTHVGSKFNIDDLSFGPAATGVQESNPASPAVFALSQNYPNPFNPSTKISYQLPIDGLVRLEVYDIMGRTLTTLVNEEKPAGQFTATFDASNFTSGIYFYRLNVIARNGKSFSQTNKMILMK